MKNTDKKKMLPQMNIQKLSPNNPYIKYIYIFNIVITAKKQVLKAKIQELREYMTSQQKDKYSKTPKRKHRGEK